MRIISDEEHGSNVCNRKVFAKGKLLVSIKVGDEWKLPSKIVFPAQVTSMPNFYFISRKFCVKYMYNKILEC